MKELKKNFNLEIAEFIAQLNPEKVIAFRPSKAAQKQVEDLIFKEKNSFLQPDEKSELNHYMAFEHLMRLAKAIAHLKLSED